MGYEEAVISKTKFFSLNLLENYLQINGGITISAFIQTEFKILIVLVKNSLMTVDRRTVLAEVFGEKALEINPETLDRHVQNIRKKMGKYGERIKSVYGVGYILYG